MRKEIEMAKPITKYEQVLSDARQQLTLAEDLLAKRRSEAVAAIGVVEKEEAVVNALRAAYGALEKSLAPQPRQRSTKKSSASPLAQKEPAADKEAKCGTCGNVKDHPDHDRSYIKSHDFEPPKSVARAPRRSSKKSEATPSIQSLETSSEDVGNAALAASGGVSGD
jgi:Arc/MetJ family transcription regulator